MNPMPSYPPLENVPEGLGSTYLMVTHAYPEGIPDSERIALMKLLLKGMSMRALAELMAFLDGATTSYMYYLDDVYGLCWHEVEEAVLQSVLDRLRSNGYNNWLESDG